MKTCASCGVIKSLDSFYSNASFCKPCHNKRGRIWAKNNKEKTRSYSYRGRIRRQYKLTPEQYENLITQQQGRCAICGILPTKRLHVDHCHNTERVRGLLCENCNRGLGMFKDNTDNLRKAIDYLL